jgi:hypothetical protein
MFPTRNFASLLAMVRRYTEYVFRIGQMSSRGYSSLQLQKPGLEAHKDPKQLDELKRKKLYDGKFYWLIKRFKMPQGQRSY